MDLLIIRHAIAFRRNKRRWPQDEERPLSPEGILRARRAAAGLKRLIGRPQRVLTSPLLRAQQTAALLAQSASWPHAVDCAELAPGRPPDAVLVMLQGAHEKLIAVVGHQPSLGELIALALQGHARPAAFELKKFGAALLSFSAAPRAGSATLSWLVPPRLLRASR